MPDAPQGVRLGDIPDQLVRRSGTQGILKHRQTQVQPRTEAGDLLGRPVSQVLLQRLLQFGEPDPPTHQFLAVSVLAQIGLTPEDVRRFLNGFVEW